MGFNIKKITNGSFRAREKEIEVPALVAFHEGEGLPVWKIRGLDGDEIGQANYLASEESQRRITSSVGIPDALKEIVGGGHGVTEDNIRRTYLLVFGSVDPKVDHTAAVKIRKYCYPAFRKITDQIALLSGQGFEPGKSKPSGTE